MFLLILGEHSSTEPHDGTDFGEGGAEFAPTLSAGPSDDGGRDLEPRLETGLTDRVAAISECNARRISVLVLRPDLSPTGGSRRGGTHSQYMPARVRALCPSATA